MRCMGQETQMLPIESFHNNKNKLCRKISAKQNVYHLAKMLLYRNFLICKILEIQLIHFLELNNKKQYLTQDANRSTIKQDISNKP